MFIFEEPSDLDSDWYLGDKRRHNGGCIPKHLMKEISNVHLIGLQFLFENFIKKRGGAILNQEEDMNMQLQVSTFLNSVKETVTVDSPVLVICPEYSLCKWHYHLTKTCFNPSILSTHNMLPSEICILTFDLLKLAQQLVDWNFSFVVIDDLDVIALKLIIRKLKGDFNIGLTRRNFYKNPDQKLKWTMLNWVSAGCVGKLNDFYSIDRLHFMAHADNYRYWWSRLTWNFSDSFERPSDDDIEEYQQKLSEWGELHKIKCISKPAEIKPKRKLNNISDPLEPKRKRKNVKKNNAKRDIPKTSNTLLSVPSSSGINKNGTSEKKIKNEVIQTNEVKFLSQDDLTNTKKNKFDPVNNSNDTSDEDTEIDENPHSLTLEEIFAINSKPSVANKRKILELDEEEPILSFINSTLKPEASGEDAKILENKKLSQSSESDSDFLSSIVKKKSSSRIFYRTQENANVLNHLSDVEENKEEHSDENDFLTKFIFQ